MTFTPMVSCSWRRLKAQMIEKRSKLGESQTLQQFSRDVDEIEAWISEKLQTASDESYKDPTNIQVRQVASSGCLCWGPYAAVCLKGGVPASPPPGIHHPPRRSGP